FRICQESNFKRYFSTICGIAIGACGSIKIEFYDQTTTGNILVCKDGFGRPNGCAYSTSKTTGDYSYARLKYNGSGKSCYEE
ncbi:hypothetical protein U1Q18_048657, partial [Sarracenia purpurea var. burkii]